MKQLLIVFLTCCFSTTVFAQTKIIGTLLEEKGQPISGASITIIPPIDRTDFFKK